MFKNKKGVVPAILWALGAMGFGIGYLISKIRGPPPTPETPIWIWFVAGFVIIWFLSGKKK